MSIIRQWLRQEIPEWAAFQISNAGKYLGIYMGPKSVSLLWAGPIHKYLERVDALHRQGLPNWLMVRNYISNIISVLLYVGQLCPSLTTSGL